MLASRTFATMSSMIGKAVPSISLYENTPGNKVNIADITKDKKVILLGIPGAFTPTCSSTHLPGYVNKYDELKKKGVDEIICITVNDPFVAKAWQSAQKADGKVRVLADTNAELTKALGLDVDIPALGGVRCKRFSSIIENNTFKAFNVEPDGTGATCTLVNPLLEKL